MKVTNKIIENVVKEVIGEEAIPIVEFLKNRKNISEFKIAEKTKTEVNIVRNILYRLHNQNLANYIKKKDRQKGWYISYWTFNSRKVKDLILKLKKINLEKYKERLRNETQKGNNFFMCKNACVRVDFYNATEFEFKCPECGNLLNQQDNSKTIELLKEKINEIESNF